MKKLLISLAIVFSFLMPAQKAHAVDAKSKAFLIMAGYGTVGGALLGFASLAFGTNSRAIAQGASLGLYAGIIFGAYVITSHNTKMNAPINDPYAPPSDDPYAPPPNQQRNYDPYAPYGGQNPNNQNGGGYGAPVPEQNSGGFFGNRAEQINMDLSQKFAPKSDVHKNFGQVPIYINLFQSTF